MEGLYHQRGIRQFVFHDDNFLVASVKRNHERLDALAEAWQERGLRDIGFTIKCRPGDAERSVFEKLRRMGLLRVFLGIESASAAGLCSIGRLQEVAASEAALDLCRDLDISAQYTLMCFHPDATRETLRADLDFFRRHIQHPLNFCRVETYAGTPLEARLRAAGRGKGDYLARTYRIADDAIDVASRLATRIFPERCWDTNSLMEISIGLDHLAGVLRRFHRGSEIEPARARVADFVRRVNQDLVEMLAELLQIAGETTGLEDPALRRRTRELVERERESRRALLAEGIELRSHVRAIGLAGAERRRRAPRLLHTAAAVTLAAAVVSCGGESTRGGAAPDTDGDGLPDQCELQIFSTNPSLADTDADGVADGDENHDFGALTNLEEQQQAPAGGCIDAADMMSEYAPPPLVDTDGDGLPDQCEQEIFGTDPNHADSDGDNVPDGDEDHDFGYLTNLEEQQQAGAYACEDAFDMMSEYAPPPLEDADGDGLPDQCEQEIFGTDPGLTDSDGNGVADGDEDSDGLGMSNLGEQTLAGPYGCQDVDDGINEMAAAPLPAPDDPAAERWARAVLGPLDARRRS
jgi:hypothetical protein